MKSYIKHIVITGLSFTLSCGAASLAVADIYQWRDSNGGIQFGNNPPKDNSTVAIITKQPLENKAIDNEVESSSEEIKISKSSIFRNSQRSNLLFQDNDKNKESRIISVRLLKENKNSLIFDVNYYLSERVYGKASIGIAPNMDNWSSVYTKAHAGRHATTILVKLSDSSSRAVVRSSSLKLSMALANDAGYVGLLFEHDLSFNKVWYKK